MLALVAMSGLGLAAQEPATPAAVPAAPTGLTYLVNGRNISLSWTAPTGDLTHYIIEAGPAPGQTFFTFSTNSLRDGPPDAATFPHLLAAFSAGGIGSGTYYVRVRAANNEGVSPPSNEITLAVTGTCQPPGPPNNPSAITRVVGGPTWLWLQWSSGPGGVPSQYAIIASDTPGGAPIVTLPTRSRFLNLQGIPNGTFYLRVIAQNACGESAPSAEMTVVAPSNSPAKVPNPTDGGLLAAPYVGDLVQWFAASNPGLLQASCPNPNSKYGLNPFLNGLVDFLRLLDTRWGYNSKPTRGPAQNGGAAVVVAGDEIAYHFGPDVPEGSANVGLIDVISGHCGPNPGLDYRVFTNGEFGRWTGAGRF